MKKYNAYTMKDVELASSMNKFEAISLFSGVGGGSLGVRLSGGKVLVANEFIPEARAAYKRNSPSTIVLPNDIRELSGDDFLKTANRSKGEIDLVEGSPPCSSFSMAGIREKGWGKEKKYSSSSQRTDDLFFECIRVINGIQPRYFILENVKGLTLGSSADILGSEQMGLFGSHEDTIYYRLTRMGYKVRYKVLNSKFFGVAQSRERLIIVGIRNDIEQTFKFPLPNRFIHIPTLAEAFNGLANTEQDLEDADISKYAVGKESLKLALGEQSTKYFSLQKQSPDRYSDTLTASASNLSAASIVHWDNRKFTVKEAIRIQGFPDDVYLGENYQNSVERLGRSITPPLYAGILPTLIK